MHVTSASPLRVASRVWPTARGGWTLTVVCKATYRLQPGESPLHDAQEPVQDEDTYWNDDPTRSLSAATDLAPFKPRADVVLVGSAYAPGKVPARSVVARLILGDLDKSLEAWCDRAWAQDGQLREGARAVKFPLRYERAAGGPESWNPVGVRRDAPPDAYGMVPLPSLQPPGLHITRRDDFIEPIGFGPIAPTWPWRWDRLGRHAGVWPHDRWWEQPLPEGFDPGFFNIASPDQQIQELHDNERLVLENLHPEHPRLVTNLPGVRPRAIADRGSIGREEIPLLCDTLWIDTDRGLCTLVWRGRLSLIHAEEPSHVVVTAERAGVPIASQSSETAPDPRVSEPPPTQPRVASGRIPEINETNTAELIDVEADDEDEEVLRTRAVALEGIGAAGPVLPFAPGPAAMPRGTVPAPPAASAGLPFSGAQEGPASSAERVDTGTKYPPLMPAASPATSRAALPFLTSVEPTPPVAPPPPSVPIAPPPPSVSAVAPVVAPIAPPPMVTRPPQLDPIVPPAASSPWGVPDRGPEPAQKASIGQLAIAGAGGGVAGASPAPVQPSPSPPAPIRVESPPEPSGPVDEAAAKRGWKPVARGEAKASAGSPPLVANAALAGAGAASNAAAASAPRTVAEPAAPVAARPVSAAYPPREAIELLWFDPASVSRIRRQPGWKEIMAQVKPHPLDDDYPGDAPPEKRQELRDRREVFGLLARAEPTDMRGIEAALTNAVREDGTFVPPLVLVAGELEFPFDELETLKATMAAAMPFASGDKKLKETLDTTEQLLQTPWLKGANSVAEGLTQKIREAFAQGNRMVPPRYLETHTERMLLEQRAYQKRTILGKQCLRTMFLVRGASKQMPVYLPSVVEGELPGFLRLTIRMIFEPKPRLEQFEEQPIAGRCIAVARVIDMRDRA